MDAGRLFHDRLDRLPQGADIDVFENPFIRESDNRGVVRIFHTDPRLNRSHNEFPQHSDHRNVAW
jgi:hypothetical protein